MEAKHKIDGVPDHCLVTGGSGFVGQRLVEMLVERGAKRVVSFDIAPKPKDALEDKCVEYVQGDITDPDTCDAIVRGVEAVYHIAAAVGPYHPTPLYTKVNYQGTVNLINSCKKLKVRKFVYSSSPSTRFTGADVDGLREDQLPAIPMKAYLAEYAKTKAMGEVAVNEAIDDNFLAVSVAPHQVYGPRDNLALPNLLEAAGTGRMRVFGKGQNRICFTHVDNYCHGLILGERALYPGSPALGKFYIVTDGATHPCKEGYAKFYESYDEAVVGMGFTSLYKRFHVPYWLIMGLAYATNGVSWCTGIRFKLNPFSVRMLTMHRWFDITNAKRDLRYEPVVSFAEEWPRTIQWFKENWLPGFHQSKKSITGLFKNTQNKIDIAAGKRKAQ